MRILGIDQSLNGCGLCVLVDAEVEFMTTIDTDDLLGMPRIAKIHAEIIKAITPSRPDVIVMEDYAYGANTNNITKLAELGGVIKFGAHIAGFQQTRDALVRGDNAFHVQTQGSMKKFCLGDGSTKKDTHYLLEVFDRMKKRFEDDNQADAYMHAWMTFITVGVLQGRVQISDLPDHQQLALMSTGIKRTKKLSEKKALSLPESEKQRLVAFTYPVI